MLNTFFMFLCFKPRFLNIYSPNVFINKIIVINKLIYYLKNVYVFISAICKNAFLVSSCLKNYRNHNQNTAVVKLYNYYCN